MEHTGRYPSYVGLQAPFPGAVFILYCLLNAVSTDIFCVPLTRVTAPPEFTHTVTRGGKCNGFQTVSDICLRYRELEVAANLSVVYLTPTNIPLTLRCIDLQLPYFAFPDIAYRMVIKTRLQTTWFVLWLIFDLVKDQRKLIHDTGSP